MSAGGVSAQQLAEIEARLPALFERYDLQSGVPGTTITIPALSDVAVLVEAVRELRAALEPFANVAAAFDEFAPSKVVNWTATVSELRRAAAVLGTPESEAKNV